MTVNYRTRAALMVIVIRRRRLGYNGHCRANGKGMTMKWREFRCWRCTLNEYRMVRTHPDRPSVARRPCQSNQRFTAIKVSTAHPKCPGLFAARLLVDCNTPLRNSFIYDKMRLPPDIFDERPHVDHICKVTVL